MDQSTLEVMFSSGKDDWETPDDLYKALDDEFHFTCDLAATENNKKHPSYFSPEQDSLKQEWTGVGFLNPPYSRKLQKVFIKKAYESSINGKVTVVMLLPSRTDTKHFHNYIYHKPNVEIRFLKGRLQFKGAKYKAPFPSMIVVFHNIQEDD